MMTLELPSLADLEPLPDDAEISLYCTVREADHAWWCDQLAEHEGQHHDPFAGDWATSEARA